MTLLLGMEAKIAHRVPAVYPVFPALSGPIAMCGGGCGREGRKYKEPLSTRGKGKGMGRFPKLTSEILSGGKRALPPLKGLASGYFLFLLLGASYRHWHLSGPQSPHQHNAKSQLLQLSIGDRLTVERGLARGRRRPAGSGTADPSKASQRQLHARRQ